MKWSDLVRSDPDKAEQQALALLDQEPDSHLALFHMGDVLCAKGHNGLALTIYETLTNAIPEKPEVWNNYGMCLSALGRHQEAFDAFKRADRLNPASPLFKANIAMAYMHRRDFQATVEAADQALKIDPESRSARNTKALALLAVGRWTEGWPLYGASLGSKFRKHIQYGDEPQWDGSPDKAVIFYGEQGLGDEIMYSSCVPDAIQTCSKVMLECDPRLGGLFRRSFPLASVYGTRRAENVAWPDRHNFEASLPAGQMPQFFRPTIESCPGAPYLVADPERRLQWRALLDSFGPEPKIGLAWSGGSPHNHPEARNCGIEGLRPLIESKVAHWVSLQYNDATAEIEASGLPIRHFRRACETPDYDDTAALVAELDLVISVPTAVVHLAGALGVNVHCLAPVEANWCYHAGMPWYHSVKVFWKNRTETWPEFVNRYKDAGNDSAARTDAASFAD